MHVDNTIIGGILTFGELFPWTLRATRDVARTLWLRKWFSYAMITPSYMRETLLMHLRDHVLKDVNAWPRFLHLVLVIELGNLLLYDTDLVVK